MKVLLVKAHLAPETQDISLFSFMEPLALEYLGAGVQERHEVKLLDMGVSEEPPLEKVLESFKPDIIACGAITVEVNPVKQVFARAKKRLPGILTVVGGSHATALPQDFFEDYVDIVVKGEGVHTFRKICDSHEAKKEFDDIGNIYYRKNGNMVFTRQEPFPDLDSLPFPARSLTAHIRSFYQTRLLYKPMRVALLRSSAGCTFNCNFCTIPNNMGKKVYKRSIDKVIEELGGLEEPFVIWVDDEFFLDHKRAILLAREIGKTGIKKQYGILCRVTTVVKHPELVEEWARIGGGGIFLGFESHKDKDLDKMGKGITVSQQQEAARIVKANNFLLRAGFIIQPYYQREDFESLKDYIKDLGLDYPSFSISTPLPGTQLWEEMEDKLITRNYNLFDQVHIVTRPALPLKEFYKHYNLLGKSIPLKTIKKFFQGLPLREKLLIFKGLAKMAKNKKNAPRYYN